MEAIPDSQKEPRELDLPSGIDNSIRPLLPEPIYIPAVKDLSDEIKTKDSTSFGRLLGILLNLIAPDLQQTEDAFEILNRKLNTSTDPSGEVIDNRLPAVKMIEDTVEKYVRENFPNVTLDIKIPPPEIKTVLSSARIWANDGVPGEIESKGDGLKRAVTFSILRTYVELRRIGGLDSSSSARSSSYLFLFEEPELYLHPIAQRILFDALGEIAKSHHVVVSTHSPLFFDPESTGTFIKLSKRTDLAIAPKPFSKALPIDLGVLDNKTRFQLVTFETNNAAFFCHTVVLVEGDSDYLVFPHVAKLINPDWTAERKGLAFCRISGKGNIAKYREFFRAFDIRVAVISDLDCIIEGFEQLGANEDWKETRDRLLQEIDEFIEENKVAAKLSARDLKDIQESPTRRAQFEKLRGVYQRCLEKKASPQDLEVAGSQFFGDEKNKKRITVLEDVTEGDILTTKRLLLRQLRQQDVFILEKGSIEAYYPDAIEGPDKPSKGLDFCKKINSREQIFGLCSQIPTDPDNTLQPEFEVICSAIFSNSQ